MAIRVEMVLTGPEWLAWKRSEQTQAFLSQLRQSESEILQDWLNDEFVSDTEFKSSMLNAGALATAQTLEQIIGTIENIVEQKKEETGGEDGK